MPSERLFRNDEAYGFVLLRTQIMKRVTVNFIVDLVSFVDLLGLVFTGIIMKYILPPGTGGCGRLLSGGWGREHIRDLWSMSRHEWGRIHYCLALLFVALIAVHIILHWSWIKNYFKSLFGSSKKKG
jgi:hypothetical protein